MGTLTLDIEISHFTPTQVRLNPRGMDGDWVESDETTPFSFTIDISEFAPGDYEMLIVAGNADAEVQKNEIVSISGCNGLQSLCNRSFDQIQVPDADPDASFLCHALCALGKQPLAEGLAEVREFLDNNPGEVITFIIESYLSHELTAAAFDAAGLTAYTYVHTGDAWPTLGQMIDAGTRLVVLQDRDVDPACPWLTNVWTHAFETHFSASTAKDFSCAVNRGIPSNDLFIFNHFLTAVFGSPDLAAQVNYNPLLLDRINECEAFHAAPANFVTVDFVDIGDAVSVVRALNDTGGF